MRKFMGKVKDAGKPSGPSPYSPQKIHSQAPKASPPINPDIFRYRYNHGTNVGSIYVLEKWLYQSMFPQGCEDGKSSELEAVKANVKELHTDKTRQKLEKHWSNAIIQQEWEWLSRDAKCSAIRLPIGYFTLGSKFARGTPFSPFEKIYQNAWSSVRRFVETANSYGIGVLLDLHAAPGGANSSDHSGTNSNKAELWNSDSNRKLTIDCLRFIAEEVKNGLPGVIGIQVCNEAEYGAQGMYDLYDWALSTFSSIDSSIPIYISDAWNLGDTIPYALKRNAKDVISNPVFIDTHFYWAFSDADKSKSPQQIIDEVPTKLGELDGQEGSIHDRGGVQIIVGEYSCVMAGEVWKKHGEGQRDELTKSFGQAQSRRWQQKTGGSFFWTLKMDWVPGGEWGFIEQTKNGAIKAPDWFDLSFTQVKEALAKATGQRDSLAQKAAAEHAAYWDGKHPDGTFEHWRFEPGWQQGWDDAEKFFTARMNGLVPKGSGEGCDRIGAIEAWTLKRCRESGMVDSGWMWEWEVGLRKGIKDFEQTVGI
ncbi:glycoside hydrolase [Pseudovirgaria hyperparasitica]|uniref:Glycoside hydrolase n=1 Tax=Pseudovirgaria hyperparasitica TaxID=470096 RepID=A0A6A6WA20_9PEZI|nr:glycoside hydrolase [Pseudovirgaria hyperparasitica]KAF2757951.1 glycoside hydrolase [Pseudovirgaria hyperparasitica]